MAVSVLDNSSTASSGSGGSSLSWSHTLGRLDGKGLIIVSATGEDTSSSQTSQRPTSATFNGVSMSLRGIDENLSGHSTTVAMFELQGSSIPGPGTYTVVVNYAGSCESRAAGCLSFKNIKQQAAEAEANTNANGTSPFTRTITTVTANALLVTAYGNQNGFTPSYSTGETSVFNSIPGSGEQCICNGAYREVAAAGSTSVSLTVSNPETEAIIVAAYATSKGFQGAMV